MHLRAFQVVPVIKNSPANAGDAGDAGSVPGRSPGEANGTYSSIRAWKSHGQRILAGNPQRIGHNWVYTRMHTCTHTHACTHTCTHTHAHTHTCMHTHTHTHTQCIHSPSFTTLYVCSFGKVTSPLYTSVSPSVKSVDTVKVLCILVNVQKS